MKPALLVIGPSRSGSSALTAVLSLLGASLPATLMPPGPGNPHGHFEPQRLMELNEEILAAHGLAYWDPIPIPPTWFDSAEAAGFTTRIAETITAEYASRPLPIIKDPRLCRTAPLHISALHLLGLTPHAIIPLRHPAAAARSLATRDNTPPETAELLQIRELLGAELHTATLPRAWSRYDDLLANWRHTTAQIAATLNLTWPTHPDQAAPAIEAFLAPSLRHHTTDTAAGPLAEHLYTATSHDEATLHTTFHAVRTILDEHDRLLAPWHTTLRARLAQLAPIVLAQARDLETRTSEIAALHTIIANLQASTSWRLTAPLRTLARLLGRDVSDKREGKPEGN